MKILIMCGGSGRRLGRLTENVPKPLVKFFDQTILDLKIKDYLNQGLNEFIFCIGYKGNLIREAVSKYEKDAKIEISDAGEEAGILERFWRAKDLFEDKVLLTYGDTFADIKVQCLVEAHEKSDYEATIVAAPIESPFGLIEFDRDNRVTFFKEKPTLTYYIGQAIINKTALSTIPPNFVQMPDGQGIVTFYKTLIALEKLGVYYHAGLEISFNTQEELGKAEKKLVRFYTAWEKQDEK